MKIELPERDGSLYRQRARDLELLLRQPSAAERRPCPGCDVRCTCSASPTCTCGCSSACAHAPRRMSSEPEIHPIEAGIVPLVYILNVLRLCPPCWSCEGHYGPGGGLGKLPSVWFHAHSDAYPALIADHLAELRVGRRIAHPWQISLVSWGSRVDTTFYIRPDLSHVSDASLRRLHADIDAIAGALVDEARRLAGRALDEIERAARRLAPATPAAAKAPAAPPAA